MVFQVPRKREERKDDGILSNFRKPINVVATAETRLSG